MKAFTIVEIVIVLILTSIVISASMLLYSNMNKLQHSSFNKGEEEASLVLLTEVLRKDCQEASLLTYSASELKCISSKKSISYLFLDNYVLRKGLVIDSFPFKAVDMHTSYADSSHTALNLLSFEFLVKADSIPFYYYKQYQPQKLIELTNSHK